MPALALIRSGGLLFVRAANEGRTVVEQFPKERVTEDFDALADQLLGAERQTETVRPPAARTGFRLFNRAKEAARA
jgi:Flp pilus assembly CpaE family ATPase